MPYLNVVTNNPIKNESAFLSKASKTISQATGKAEDYVMVSCEVKPAMMMAGSENPLAFLDYRALGLPADRTAFADTLCGLISDQLGINGERVYISMTDSERKNWGWNHQTF